jgi:uncharacterized protein (TIGR00255 family)
VDDLCYNTIKSLKNRKKRQEKEKEEQMVMSMTGFGRASTESEGVKFTVEVKTLNHRYLDINIRLPRNVSFLEEDIRNLIKDNLARGRVDVYISSSVQGGEMTRVEVNKPLADSYLACFNELAESYHLDKNLSLSLFSGLSDIFMPVEKEQNEEQVGTLLLKATNDAIAAVKEMRSREGVKISEDICKRAGLISSMVKAIEERAPVVIDEYRSKLKNRISELLRSTDLDENRFNAEVLYFAERSNITEEIVRLQSHLEQLKEIMNQDDSIGRKLDFLVQEMNREANTIGSKSGDLTIVNLVVDMKSEIEKIREQVQNIE